MTFLHCVNPLETITAGHLWVGGELVGYRQYGDKLYETRPEEAANQRRDIGVVFQSLNLFPHKTALENLMLALTLLEERREGDPADACDGVARPGWARGSPRLLSGHLSDSQMAAGRNRGGARN